MLRITNLQFLYRSQGVFDMLLSSTSRIKLSINEEYDYVDLEQKTSNAKVVWNTDSLPAIELPPFNNENSFTFQLYKDNNYVGKSRSFVQLGRDKKGTDCLDIVNKDFQIIGKLLYEAKWSPVLYQQKMITLQQYYTQGKGTSKPNPYTTVGIERQEHEQAIKMQQSAKENKHRKRAIFGYDDRRINVEKAVGCFGCFSSKKKKPTGDHGESKRLDNQAMHNLTPIYYSQNPYETKPHNQ